jgi:spermidine/putrescine transport system ATP-binding protein
LKQPAVEIDNVCKAFSDAKAVDCVSLTIEEGEFFSLLGPSGCGKTTLLRMIAGFEQPTSGIVRVAGKDMTAVPPHKRPVNMVFQSYALFPHLNVFDNVAFGLKVTKACAKEEVEPRVKEALELVRLPQMIKRFPRELSGGQQQRVAFARAIVNKPAVLLLDEPLSALDPRIRQDMQTELARFKKELGITFVMVTHDQAEAFALSDRVAVLNHGCLEQVGAPEEIYERPRSAFVADFIGETNILSGKVAEVKGNQAVLVMGDNQRLDAVLDEAVSAGEDAVVWIRTESFVLSPSDDLHFDEERVNKYAARILSRSYQGNSCLYQLKVGDLVLTASARHAAGESFAADGEINVYLPARHVHMLPEKKSRQAGKVPAVGALSG